MTTISEALREFGNTPYVLTVGDHGPHTSHSTVSLAADGTSLTGPLSKSAAKNVGSQPAMSLFWPPREPGGYGIIMNGVAQLIATEGPAPLANIALTKAVFHRPGDPGPGHEGPCTSDCRPIRLTKTS